MRFTTRLCQYRWANQRIAWIEGLSFCCVGAVDMESLVNGLRQAFRIPPPREEGNDRTTKTQQRLVLLQSKQELYMNAVEARRAKAAEFVARGFRAPARNELIQATYYNRLVNIVSGHLLSLQVLVAAHEQAKMGKETVDTANDILQWTARTVAQLDPKMIQDQSNQRREIMAKIDQFQHAMNQPTDAAIQQTLTPDDMNDIDKELEDMWDNRDEDEEEHSNTSAEADESVFQEIRLPRQPQRSLLLVDEDE
jgi:hypothetical protein